MTTTTSDAELLGVVLTPRQIWELLDLVNDIGHETVIRDVAGQNQGPCTALGLNLFGDLLEQIAAASDQGNRRTSPSQPFSNSASQALAGARDNGDVTLQ